MLYLIPFLHQTTTSNPRDVQTLGCILFHFYIKPQHALTAQASSYGCILFHFYIKPQRFSSATSCQWVVSYSISTSNHNFLLHGKSINTVVSYSISTSNHNEERIHAFFVPLYLIPFLHQTTTLGVVLSSKMCCILFHFYIKPQPPLCEVLLSLCCILFHFYIKPQPIAHKTLFSSTLSPKSHPHFQRNAVV